MKQLTNIDLLNNLIEHQTLGGLEIINDLLLENEWAFPDYTWPDWLTENQNRSSSGTRVCSRSHRYGFSTMNLIIGSRVYRYWRSLLAT
jgi:hypothetical protein